MGKDLKAEEVRVGNIINKEGYSYKIVDHEIIEELSVGEEGYQGVPVTEDVFEKLFDFERALLDEEDPEIAELVKDFPEAKFLVFFKDDLSFELLPNKDNEITNNVLLTFYDTHVESDGVLSQHGTTEITLDNLMIHELQNLWYAIKREELEFDIKQLK